MPSILLAYKAAIKVAARFSSGSIAKSSIGCGAGARILFPFYCFV
jgi:hypothetical protein